MNNISFEKQLSDYIDGSMTDKEKIEFEVILSNDKELADKALKLKRMILDIKRIKPLELPNSFDIKLKEAIDNYGNKVEKFNLFKIFDNSIYAAIGSVAAIILIVAVTQFSISSYSVENTLNSSLAENIEEKQNNDKNKELNDKNDFDIQRVDFDIKYEDY